MKIPSKSRTVEVTPEGQVTIHFSESLKQTANYQSADINVGVSLPCGNSDQEIKAAFLRAEGLVEAVLVVKARQQKKILLGSGKD